MGIGGEAISSNEHHISVIYPCVVDNNNWKIIDIALIGCR